jgi:hypothetical protein
MKWILIFCQICFFATNAQTGCKLQTEKDSIKVFSCPVENSKYKALRVEFELKANYSQVAAMILDIENLHRWQYKTVSAVTLKRMHPNELIYYTEVQTPSVTNNRDFVIHLSINQNPINKELEVKAVSKPTYVPEKKKVVRVPFSEAHWKIKATSSGKLAVTYNLQIDFGGAVPAWVVNSLSHLAPLETFRSMQLEISKYRGARVDGIRD